MAGDKPIFGLLFGADPRLQPSPAELESFFKASRKQDDGRHANLASYRAMLDAVSRFGQEAEPDGRNVRERIWYGVLGHSSFFHPALLSAVELYAYHLHELMSLDFRKPSAFIAAAEKEMAGLHADRKAEAAKLTRLRGMVDDRRSALRDLQRRKDALARELRSIVLYVRDNLVRIAGLCEKAIVLLVQLQIEGTEERRLIADIREHFKQELKDSLRRGTVTRQHLDAALRDAAELSGELSAVVREDAFALSTVYEAVRERTADAAGRLDQMIGLAENARLTGIEEEREIFRELDGILVSLLSDFRVAFKPAVLNSKTGHPGLLEKKREELLSAFFAETRRERRERSDRRKADRRQGADPGYQGAERRSGIERRTNRGRRRS